jgi:hypothetical protein
MGRLLVLAGVVMMSLSIFAIVSGFVTSIGGAVSTAVNTAVSTPDAAEYCEPGERLEQSQGLSVYTPGQGYARSVQYYCVDEDGNRREVTGEFAENLFGGVSGIFSAFSSPLRIEYLALFGLGILSVILGIVISVRRAFRVQPQPTNFDFSGAPVGSPSGNVVQVNGQEYITSPELARRVQNMQNAAKFTTFVVGQQGGDLTERLRQLDEALKANLITQDEYDRLRQQILNQIG